MRDRWLVTDGEGPCEVSFGRGESCDDPAACLIDGTPYCRLHAVRIAAEIEDILRARR